MHADLAVVGAEQEDRAARLQYGGPCRSSWGSHRVTLADGSDGDQGISVVPPASGPNLSE
ncbi:hypothetical protein GCM10020229_82720 [Kitasatospora albolonga]